MAKIEINQKHLAKHEKLELDFLPVKIDGDGFANANDYFKNYTRTENTILHNALRGYPLCGVKLDVPVEYKALVLQESNGSNDENRTLRVTGSFSEFNYWNYDKIPSKADSYNQALDWTKIASQIAEPILEADVLAEIESHDKETAAKENIDTT